MERTLEEIAALAGGEVVGDGSLPIRGVSSAAGGRADTITFAEDGRTLAAAFASAVGAVLVGRDADVPEGRAAVRVDRPRLAFVRVAAALHPEKRPDPPIHPTAVVEAGATVGRGTVIGPYCHVGEGVAIGEDCRLFAHVVLYPGVTLGNRVRVHAGAVLGADGFGYVDTPEGKEKFPQLGTLVVEDDVEIGANATIDRGALDATVIRAGTKIDNLVQIAHNVEIGRLCALSAQTGIAGTSKLGDRVTCGGQVGIGDHVKIGDGAVIAGQTGVPSGKDLPGAAVYWGAAARPIGEVKRQLAAVSRIERLHRRVRELESRLAALEGEAR